MVGDVYGFRKGAVGQLAHPVRVATALGGRMPTLFSHAVAALLMFGSRLPEEKYHESAKSAPSVSCRFTFPTARLRNGSHAPP